MAIPYINTTEELHFVVGTYKEIQFSLQQVGYTGPFEWSVTAGSLSQVALSTEGLLSGEATSVDAFTVTIQVTNNVDLTTSKSFNINIVAPDTFFLTNDHFPQEIDRYPRGNEWQEAVFVGYGGIEPYSYSISAGAFPGGATINAGTGDVAYRTPEGGTFSVTIHVEDASPVPLTYEKEFIFEVAEIPAYTVNYPPPPVEIGVPYSYEPFTGLSGGVLPYSFTIEFFPVLFNTTDFPDQTVELSSILEGLTFDPATGIISGTATQYGMRYFDIVFYDAMGGVEPLGGSGRQTQLLICADPATPRFYPSCEILGVDPTADSTAMTNDNKTTYYDPNDGSLVIYGGTPPYTVTVEAGEFVPGLTVNSDGSGYTGLIEDSCVRYPLYGNSTPDNPAIFRYTLKVEDSLAVSSTHAFQTRVYKCPIISSASVLPIATAGKFYSYKFINDQDYYALSGAGVNYTLGGGLGLPPLGYTLQLDGPTAGTLSGVTPDASKFDFEVASTLRGSTFTDYATIPGFNLRAFTLYVVDENIIVTPSTLPNYQKDVPLVPTQFYVWGGVGPYTWDIIYGALPTGLSFSVGGLLTGTPTVAGLYSFTVGVTDSLGKVGSQNYIVEVRVYDFTFTGSTASITIKRGTTQTLQFTLTGENGYDVLLVTPSIPSILNVSPSSQNYRISDPALLLPKASISIEATASAPLTTYYLVTEARVSFSDHDPVVKKITTAVTVIDTAESDAYYVITDPKTLTIEQGKSSTLRVKTVNPKTAYKNADIFVNRSIQTPNGLGLLPSVDKEYVLNNPLVTTLAVNSDYTTFTLVASPNSPLGPTTIPISVIFSNPNDFNDILPVLIDYPIDIVGPVIIPPGDQPPGINDFTLLVVPQFLMMLQAATENITVTAVPSPHLPWFPTVTVFMPSSANGDYVFSPASFVLDTSNQSQIVQVQTFAESTTGNYPITITGTAPGYNGTTITREARMKLGIANQIIPPITFGLHVNPRIINVDRDTTRTQSFELEIYALSTDYTTPVYCSYVQVPPQVTVPITDFTLSGGGTKIYHTIDVVYDDTMDEYALLNVHGRLNAPGQPPVIFVALVGFKLGTIPPPGDNYLFDVLFTPTELVMSPTDAKTLSVKPVYIDATTGQTIPIGLEQTVDIYFTPVAENNVGVIDFTPGQLGLVIEKQTGTTTVASHGASQKVHYASINAVLRDTDPIIIPPQLRGSYLIDNNTITKHFDYKVTILDTTPIPQYVLMVEPSNIEVFKSIGTGAFRFKLVGPVPQNIVSATVTIPNLIKKIGNSDVSIIEFTPNTFPLEANAAEFIVRFKATVSCDPGTYLCNATALINTTPITSSSVNFSIKVTEDPPKPDFDLVASEYVLKIKTSAVVPVAETYIRFIPFNSFQDFVHLTYEPATLDNIIINLTTSTLDETTTESLLTFTADENTTVGTYILYVTGRSYEYRITKTIKIVLIIIGPDILQIKNKYIPCFKPSEQVNVQLEAQFGEPPYSWSATGLPNYLTLDANGLIKGEVLEEGRYTVSISVTDTQSVVATSNYVINIIDNCENPPNLDLFEYLVSNRSEPVVVGETFHASQMVNYLPFISKDE